MATFLAFLIATFVTGCLFALLAFVLFMWVGLKVALTFWLVVMFLETIVLLKYTFKEEVNND